MEVLSKAYSTSFSVGMGAVRDLRCRLFAGIDDDADIADFTYPTSDRKINLDGHFNCGLTVWKGKLLLASRLGWTRATCHISELGADFQPITTTPLNITHPNGHLAAEDPRIFVYAGQLHLSTISFEMINHRIKIHQFLVRLSDSLEVDDVWIPRYQFRNENEKNWQFFQHEGELLSVYSIQPHTVLRHRAGFAERIAETPGPATIPAVRLRGGAPPFRVGNEYYHFFHSWERQGEMYFYTMGVYTFESRWPFEVKRIGPRSLISCHPNETPWQGDKFVVFPCGAVLRNGEWLISYGYQDRECRLATFDFEQIEKQLLPISRFT